MGSFPNASLSNVELDVPPTCADKLVKYFEIFSRQDDRSHTIDCKDNQGRIDGHPTRAQVGRGYHKERLTMHRSRGRAR